MKTFILAISFLAASFTALASESPFSGRKEDVPTQKRTDLGLYLLAKDAPKFLDARQGKALFLDIRSREEVAFLGMPAIADANVPYAHFSSFNEWDDKKNNFKMDLNGTFGKEVAGRMAQKGLTQSDPVILLCRSGDRSARAANLLAKLGYTAVYSVIDGFEGDMAPDGRRSVNGWKNSGLPWSYVLDKSKMTLSN